MKVNVFAEPAYAVKGGGIYSAFIECIKILESRGIEVKVNSEEKCDILHSHTTGPRFIQKAQGYKGRCVVVAHTVPATILGRFAFAKYWLPLFTFYLKVAYNQGTVVQAVSPLVKTQLEEIGVKSEIMFLPNGINRKRFKIDEELKRKFREKYGVGQDEFVVFCAAQLLPAKGVETFCKTAQLVPEARFIWAGGRPLGRMSSDYVKTSQLIDHPPRNVIFTGNLAYAEGDQLVAAYNSGDAFMFPSYQENFSMSILEGSAFKMPLLLRDIVEYHVYGDTYLKAKTEEEFARNIQRLMKDKSFYNEYSKKADSIAVTYDIEKVTDRLIDIYRRLLKS